MLLTVSGDLQQLLKREFRGQDKIAHELKRRASAKDVVESFGIPHTEVGEMRANGREISFSHIVENNISPCLPPIISQVTALRVFTDNQGNYQKLNDIPFYTSVPAQTSQ